MSPSLLLLGLRLKIKPLLRSSLPPGLIFAPPIVRLSRFILTLIFAHSSLACARAATAEPSLSPFTPSSTPGVPPADRYPPAYPIPYAPASTEEITEVIGRVLRYLDTVTPVGLVDSASGQAVTDLTALPKQVALSRGDFLLESYEWGVTYAGMLLAWEITGDTRFKEYTSRRLATIQALADHFRAIPAAERPERFPVRGLVAPNSLDDCGAMSAALIKAQQAGAGGDFRPLIDHALDFIENKQFRFSDRTLARNRPGPNSLWLDDLYMSVPALAQMGKLTGDIVYFDDAVKQLLQFSQRMFVKEKGLYLHGWIEGMQEHPRYLWGRANGWAAMAAVELLSVLPETHPGRASVLGLLREHVRGLAAAQGVNGLWHQLLDRPETYEETSASAMFVFAMARAINRNWIDALAYGPTVSIGWNAVAQKVNFKGQVEGTCVGTGMGWEPTFYAYRPTSLYAAHGYGPVLLAGAEMIAFRRGRGAEAAVQDGAVHLTKAIPTKR